MLEHISEYQGIRYWMEISGILNFRRRVYVVTGVERRVTGDIVCFQEFRTQQSRRQHQSMMNSFFFKPFVIPGGLGK